ncbi:MAG: NifU family protein [Phycisphaerales bacterium]|nr:NifU family protein [Phycisphaerales bacterium]
MVRVTQGSNPIDGSSSAEGLPVEERVSIVIDRIRPAVQNDGGDIELVEVTDDGVVRIRMHGACVGCPSSNMTLRLGIEQNLKTYVPEITGVEAIEEK